MPPIEYADILTPPLFTKSGQIKPVTEAWEAGDWIGTFNLWIVSTENPHSPAMLYQQRSPNSAWEPGKLDLTAGGHYQAGESLEDGVREVQEELGRSFNFNELMYLGRRLNVSFDSKGRTRNNVVDVSLLLDPTPLSGYKLQESEVTALFSCPMHELRQMYVQEGYSFTAHGVYPTGEEASITVSRESFPMNWDNYHAKMVNLVDRVLAGEPDIFY